jgi:hypothetical protein
MNIYQQRSQPNTINQSHQHIQVQELNPEYSHNRELGLMIQQRLAESQQVTPLEQDTVSYQHMNHILAKFHHQNSNC